MRVLRQIHAHVLTLPLPISTLSFSLSKIVGFCCHSPLGDLDYARKLFSFIPNPNNYSWNSLIKATSLVQNPSSEPFHIFKKMISRGHTKSNTFTLTFVLRACSFISALKEGQQVHSRVLRSGFHSSPFVQTALVDFYAECKEIKSARKVFDEIPDRDVIAWSAMMSGYSKVEMYNDALSSFTEMQKVGVVPDGVTMAIVISACAALGALDVGRWVHAYIDKQSIKFDLYVSTALVDMYAKCGCMDRAKEVFDAMPVKDTIAWNSMIVGLAINGHAEDALEVFSLMEKAKVRPNHVTFLGVLMACAHGGLVSKGRKYWSIMLESGVEPTMDNHSCMVDLLCRANLTEDAFAFVETMPFAPNPAIWRTLLVRCMKNKNMEKGEVVAERLLELEPLYAGNYIILSNMYASCAEWAKVSLVRKEMKDKGIKTVPGCTSIEIDGFTHEFVMGGWSHPESEEIRDVLRDISKRVRDTGHEPWISAVLHNTDDEEKENALCEHSERLAIAYGMLKTKAPVVIRIVKNLRVCEDCHEVTKIISKLYKREIIARDRVRFHKFVNGICSCRDFW